MHRAIIGTIITAAMLATLASAGTADAAPHRPKCPVHHVARRAHTHNHRHGRMAWVRRRRCAKVIATRATVIAPASVPRAAAAIASAPATGLTPPPANALPALPTSGAPPSILGVGNVPGCLYGADPVPTLKQHVGASVMRVIISPLGSAAGVDGEAAPCLADALAAGYRVELAIQWPSAWSDAQIAALFTAELGYYGADAWAVAVGNEQELVGDTAASYAEHWRVVAPIVRQHSPRALLVAGEISPWGMGFLQQAWADGLPGAQVIAAHTYQVQNVFSIPAVEAWCAQIGLPLWVTEGMAGPGEWSPGYELASGQLLGVQAGFVWLG